jgi:hypothetical protein
MKKRKKFFLSFFIQSEVNKHSEYITLKKHSNEIMFFSVSKKLSKKTSFLSFLFVKFENKYLNMYIKEFSSFWLLVFRF